MIASLLMLSGSTADRIGRKRMFQTGLSLFSLGSLLCAVAPSLGLLIAARVLQAVGGSFRSTRNFMRVYSSFPRVRNSMRACWSSCLRTPASALCST